MIIKGNLLVKNIKFIINIDSNISNTKCNSVKIQQILNNLLGNAIKFTNNGSITVSVNRIKDYIKFSITDTGNGINIEKQKHIFTKYIESNTGTGLGLSICKKIIDELHGKIGFESYPEKGSTFWFNIPVNN